MALLTPFIWRGSAHGPDHLLTSSVSLPCPVSPLVQLFHALSYENSPKGPHRTAFMNGEHQGGERPQAQRSRWEAPWHRGTPHTLALSRHALRSGGGGGASPRSENPCQIPPGIFCLSQQLSPATAADRCQAPWETACPPFPVPPPAPMWAWEGDYSLEADALNLTLNSASHPEAPAQEPRPKTCIQAIELACTPMFPHEVHMFPQLW